MTRNERSQVSAWTAIFIAAVSVLISAGTLGIYAINLHHQNSRIEVVAAKAKHISDCNRAYLQLDKAARDARLPYSDKQNDALIAAFQIIVLRPGLTPPAQQLADLRKKGGLLIDAGKDFKAVREYNPFPTSICPSVKGITTP